MTLWNKNKLPVVIPVAKVAPTITSSGPPYSRTGNQRVEVEALVMQKTDILDDQNEPVYRVRRITPLECERLMGFEDHYTGILYKGKEAPDTLRYKALGNSMAVPVMRWIGERIQKVADDSQRTH